jgi:hypothetical protein
MPKYGKAGTEFKNKTMDWIVRYLELRKETNRRNDLQEKKDDATGGEDNKR